jgi:hypothetical protein
VLVGLARGLRDRGVEGVVLVLDLGPGLDRRRRRIAEAASDEPRLDHDHLDAVAAHLEAERVAQGLDRVLGRVVEGPAGKHQAPAHRAEVHDPPGPPPAHPGEHEPGQLDEAEDVRLELGPHALHRDGLERARLGVSGVVDERPDRAVLGLDRGDRIRHRGRVGEVERQRPAAGRAQVAEPLGLACRRPHIPPVRGQAAGGRGADAG